MKSRKQAGPGFGLREVLQAKSKSTAHFDQLVKYLLQSETVKVPVRHHQSIRHNSKSIAHFDQLVQLVNCQSITKCNSTMAADTMKGATRGLPGPISLKHMEVQVPRLFNLRHLLERPAAHGEAGEIKFGNICLKYFDNNPQIIIPVHIILVNNLLVSIHCYTGG